jgi:pyruvate dehydrogenase phosphatase
VGSGGTTSRRYRGQILVALLPRALITPLSNAPCEDTHAEAVLPVPSGRWSFFGVYDGHSGWETSTLLREQLITAVSGALADLYHSVLPASASSAASDAQAHPDPSPEAVERTLKAAFRALDDDMVHGRLDEVFSAPDPRAAAARALGPAYAGACALLAFYDSHGRMLHVALTGDSRAVLGRRVPA